MVLARFSKPLPAEATLVLSGTPDEAGVFRSSKISRTLSLGAASRR